MNLYMAPMEAITGYIYRNAYKEFFGDIDKYFTPFLSDKKLSNKAKNELNPDNNKDIYLVPQILTNKSEDFISLSNQIHDLFGYNEVNLNLGCPSGTVVSKKRGSGFLSVLDELDRFLEQIYSQTSVHISIKTRIGIESLDEWEKIIYIYNQYPLKELIIHPRLQKDFYKGSVHLDIFKLISESTHHALCYNGDIISIKDYENIKISFPDTKNFMIGRGIIANPGFPGEIKGKASMKIETLKKFHDKIYNDYKEIMYGDKSTLFKMKEIWTYLSSSFIDSKKHFKKVKKAQSLKDYDQAVDLIFKELELL